MRTITDLTLTHGVTIEEVAHAGELHEVEADVRFRYLHEPQTWDEPAHQELEIITVRVIAVDGQPAGELAARVNDECLARVQGGEFDDQLADAARTFDPYDG